MLTYDEQRDPAKRKAPETAQPVQSKTAKLAPQGAGFAEQERALAPVQLKDAKEKGGKKKLTPQEEFALQSPEEQKKYPLPADYGSGDGCLEPAPPSWNRRRRRSFRC